MTKPMSEEKAIELKKRIDPAWDLENHATSMVRKFKFRNFKDPMSLAAIFGEIAEEENHHPELTISWGSLTAKITTHTAKGLTESDFALAEKFDRAYFSFP